MIKKLRKDKGLTQQQLAELAGCDQSYISNIEKNPQDCNLTIDTIFYISDSLDADFLELLIYLGKSRVEVLGKK